ncbi:MAG: cell division protein ZapA [Nitrospiraceae bacterium]|nr:cell division protein ZapA [Nitrospiraceae bacterium]
METIQVEIFGQKYSLKGGSSDGRYVRELAAFVDGRMKEVQKGTGTADGFRIAILTALNIADELYRIRAQQDSTQKTVSNGIDRIMELTADTQHR